MVGNDKMLSEWILNAPRLTTREEIAEKVAALEARLAGLMIFLARYNLEESIIDRIAKLSSELHTAEQRNAELREAVQHIIDGEEYYKGKESANDYDATIEAICAELNQALETP